MPPGGCAGDYNNDGSCNAADYTVWRDLLGTNAQLSNESATPDSVTMEDYYVWKANFGASVGVGSGPSVRSGAASGVPEPASWMLAAMAMLPLAWRRAGR